MRARDTLYLEARFRDPSRAMAGGGPRLILPPGFEPNPPAVRSTAAGSVIWRLHVSDPCLPGSHVLRLAIPDKLEPQEKAIVVGKGWQRVSPQRVDRRLAQVLYPGEPRLPSDSGLEAIRLTYPPRELALGGFSFEPVWTFLVLTICWGLVLKRPLRVEI